MSDTNSNKNNDDGLNWFNLDCETFKTAAIALAEEFDRKLQQESAERELNYLREAYSDLKTKLPNLKINEQEFYLELCGESYRIVRTSIRRDGVSGWALLGTDGSFISDPISYGGYLKNKAARIQRCNSRSWWSKLFGDP